MYIEIIADEEGLSQMKAEIEDIVGNMKYRDSQELAEVHVDWFLQIIRPFLIEHMIHGYKHGYKAVEKKTSPLPRNKLRGFPLEGKKKRLSAF